MEQLAAAIPAFKPTQQAAPVTGVFPEAELRGLRVPALLLVGERDVTCNPRRGVERAQRLMPHIEAELIHEGGHLFQVEQAEVTNARLLVFLTA